ncbi:hypothetical protein B0H17DRAFT_1151498 [Mycena rosella]|uniref:Uncharacterized protein n=1 Tax=Mycena rosella TaxID=1033263 RepID=A0AAD7FGI2_MYCRO|nr:hypothetical protein B0H17DRAFT_1151498 [Mycena rosella]
MQLLKFTLLASVVCAVAGAGYGQLETVRFFSTKFNTEIRSLTRSFIMFSRLTTSLQVNMTSSTNTELALRTSTWMNLDPGNFVTPNLGSGSLTGFGVQRSLCVQGDVSRFTNDWPDPKRQLAFRIPDGYVQPIIMVRDFLQTMDLIPRCVGFVQGRQNLVSGAPRVSNLMAMPPAEYFPGVPAFARTDLPLLASADLTALILKPEEAYQMSEKHSTPQFAVSEEGIFACGVKPISQVLDCFSSHAIPLLLRNFYGITREPGPWTPTANPHRYKPGLRDHSQKHLLIRSSPARHLRLLELASRFELRLGFFLWLAVRSWEWNHSPPPLRGGKQGMKIEGVLERPASLRGSAKTWCGTGIRRAVGQRVWSAIDCRVHWRRRNGGSGSFSWIWEGECDGEMGEEKKSDQPSAFGTINNHAIEHSNFICLNEEETPMCQKHSSRWFMLSTATDPSVMCYTLRIRGRRAIRTTGGYQALVGGYEDYYTVNCFSSVNQKKGEMWYKVAEEDTGGSTENPQIAC